MPKKPTEPRNPWYTLTPVGRNRLNFMMKDMCKEAEFDITFTNHSLKAYGATKMFQAKVPEKLIQQRTGHKSLEALRCYEHTSLPQLVDVSNVMANDSIIMILLSTASSVIQTYQSTTTCANTAGDTPSIMFKGCTFIGCAISMSGQASNENKYENGMQNLFQGTDIDDTYL